MNLRTKLGNDPLINDNIDSHYTNTDRERPTSQIMPISSINIAKNSNIEIRVKNICYEGI